MNYRILAEEGTEVNINGVGYAAGAVVDLDENEEAVKIALSDGQIEATEAEEVEESEEEESEEGEGEDDEEEGEEVA